jgi:virulence-associated protein VapD
MKKNCSAKLAKKVVTKDGFERIQAILYIKEEKKRDISINKNKN